MEETNINNIDDTIESIPVKEVIETTVEKPSKKITNKKEVLINCLRKERIIIRHVPKQRGMITNPKHALYGGMTETATRTFVVPKLTSGAYTNVLTDSEKNFLEQSLGLEPNALSIYRKVDNFWDDNIEGTVARVRLTKQDNYLDLSIPEDYIKYKILLANKNHIAPSLKALMDFPKSTYQFVIIAEGEEENLSKNTINIKMKCYKEYGKVEEDKDILRLIVETLLGKPTSPDVKLSFLQSKIDDLIVADSKLFYSMITDPLLKTKVLLKQSIEKGTVFNRGGMLYLSNDNSPLCEHNQEPTLDIAAKYINSPRRQEIKFLLESKLK